MKLETAQHPKRPVLVQGFDCYFFDNLDQLATVWPGPRNEQSTGALLMGFFRYFNEVFDFENEVVCVRGPEPLTKAAKNWTDRKMAIEDPFELDHNLVKGVSGKNLLLVVEFFRRARLHFGLSPANENRFSLLPNVTMMASFPFVTFADASGCRSCCLGLVVSNVRVKQYKIWRPFISTRCA
jgi:terminal uridylyltransferase